MKPLTRKAQIKLMLGAKRRVEKTIARQMQDPRYRAAMLAPTGKQPKD